MKILRRPAHTTAAATLACALLVSLIALGGCAAGTAARPLASAQADTLTPTASLDQRTPTPGLALGPWTGYTIRAGAIQGVSVVGDGLYIYCDADTGVVHEFDLHEARTGRLVPTGRVLRLTVGGRNVASHPTGLTSLDGRTAILGDTVGGVGRIYFLDWERAWRDGTLDNAILHTVLDDAAVNGTRPHYVRYRGRWHIATSDYGEVDNALRLYDPRRLRRAARTSEAGVQVASFPCGPFVQNVHWLDELGVLVLVQNQVAGLGYRLTPLSLVGAADGADLRAAPAIDLERPTDELEGFAALGGGMAVMVSAMPTDNVWLGPLRVR